MPYSIHGLSAETVALLTDAGLRPLDVESLAVRALEEDVDGGVDVTTVATVPMEQRGRLALVARVLVEHAQAREESRGSHWREDYPDPQPEWRVRLVTTMDFHGSLHTVRRSPDWLPGSLEDSEV